MISVLTQERLLGFALGSAFMSGLVFQNRRSIHRLVSDTNSVFGDQPQIKSPIPIAEEKCRLDVAHYWNKAVDSTFGRLIESLSSRGW